MGQRKQQFQIQKYIPYLLEGQDAITMQNAEQPENTAEVPILGFTQEAPLLREEYDNYALIWFVPLSEWNRIAGIIGNVEANIYIRVLAEAPIVPVVIFILAIFGFVALAYYMGGKKMMECSLVEALRSDNMV